jgi:hypothetical protein
LLTEGGVSMSVKFLSLMRILSSMLLFSFYQLQGATQEIERKPWLVYEELLPMCIKDEENHPAAMGELLKHKPVVTSSGTVIYPLSIVIGEPEDLLIACCVDVKRYGRKWVKKGPISLSHRRFGITDPVLFYDKLGRLRILCRDTAYKMGEKGFMWQAISPDEGGSWFQLTKTILPSSGTSFDIADLGKGKIILVYNHSHTDQFPLHIAFSLDGGDNWSPPIVLDEVGELPSAVATSDGCIHVTYTVAPSDSKQRRIKHVAINPEKLFQQ